MMSKRVSFSKDIETRLIDDIDRQSEESRSDEESRQINKFQLLDLVDGNGSSEKGDESVSDEAIHSDGSSGSDSRDRYRQSSSKQNVKKAAKKSRNRKNKKGNKQNRHKGEAYEEQEFDIELVSGKDETKTTYSEQNKHIKLLKLDTRNLLPENELKRIFGKSVIRDDRRNQAHGGQRSKFVNLRFVDTRQLSMFVGPKMELDDFLNEIQNINQEKEPVKQDDSIKAKAKKDIQPNKAKTIDTLFNSNRPVYFKFVHDREYQSAQKKFVEAVHTAHAEAIVHNLSIYPNHAESLLQLSHIIRLSEDFKQASEMVERALITFERGFHTRFNLATAQCRLSYRRPENRTFFLTIFEQICSCHRRGLRKTPLEYSKLLLSLEPETDPLMATQLLDFFALRSEEYDFLIEFYHCWWQVQRLPNMNFSLALAYFLKSKLTKQSKADCDKFVQLADEQLQKSLYIFPNFILPLLEASAGTPSDQLKKCTYFDYSPYSNKYKTVPETLEVLIELYVKRSFGLWKQKQTLIWLERNVATMVNKFATGELKDDGKAMGEHWAQFKKPAPKNLLRHIALCDLKIKMPPSASVSTFLAVDPFPPTDAIVTYHTRLHQTTRYTSQANYATGSIPSLFLRSFLPSFSMAESLTQEQPRTSTNQDRATTRDEAPIDTDQEIAIGDFVLDQLEAEQAGPGPGGDFNAFQDSIRNLAHTLSDLITLSPLVTDSRGNQDAGNRANRSDNGGQSGQENQRQQPNDQQDLDRQRQPDED